MSELWSTTIFGSTGQPYLVEERPDTRLGGPYLFCPCPGWKFAVAKGGCKHVKEAEQQRAVGKRTVLTPMTSEQKATIAGANGGTTLSLPIKPMLAAASVAPGDGRWPMPFDRDDYSFEEKLDGHRTIAVREGDKVELWTRAGNRVGYDYPEIVRTIREKAPPSCIMDGEIVVYERGAGRTSFQRLQNLKRLSVEDRAEHLCYVAFDLLAVDGKDVQREPLFERRKRLLALDSGPNFMPLEPVYDGKAAWEVVLRDELEGIIAKPLRSRYLQDNRGIWTKHKRNVRQVFDVIGMTSGEGSRAGVFGALILGEQRGELIHYAGKCGTGFDGAAIASVLEALAPGLSKEPTVDRVQAIRVVQHLGNRKVVWIRPGTAKVMVEFNDYTDERIVRMGSFKGLVRDTSV